MKAISLWQPWASLVAIGAKRIETRSWATSYRGPIAIHSAKRWTVEQLRIAQSEPFCSALDGLDDLPGGAIIAVANLTDCLEIDEPWRRDELTPMSTVNDGGRYRYGIGISELEASFGDYRRGRFAWFLDQIHRLDQPVPCRGGQRIFEVHTRFCRVCGCTDEDCSGCIERTSRPCYWVDEDLCSACANRSALPTGGKDARPAGQ